MLLSLYTTMYIYFEVTREKKFGFQLAQNEYNIYEYLSKSIYELQVIVLLGVTMMIVTKM